MRHEGKTNIPQAALEAIEATEADVAAEEEEVEAHQEGVEHHEVEAEAASLARRVDRKSSSYD